MTIAFFGIHLPLIAYMVYIALKQGFQHSVLDLSVVLAATLIGTAGTLWLQYWLLAPVRATTRAVKAYHANRELPKLPVTPPDEAGELMRNTQECLEALDQLFRLKDHLAAGIAHDFRSPLTGIALAADFMVEDPKLGPVHRKFANSIKRTAEAQLRLVSGLLEAVLDDTRNARFESKAVRVADLWTEVGATLAPMAEHRGLTLEFVPTDAVVAGDDARLTQILNNLVSNAIKATPAGGRVVLAACAANRGWRLSVADTGPGVDAEDIMSRLKAGESVGRAGEKSRLGLGLRMVNALLRLHASQLYIKSEPGQGAEFSFTLAAANT